MTKQLVQIPPEQRDAVREVTMDFSDSMFAIVKAMFPNAGIVIDCFHIVKRLCDGLDEMRMRFRRQAVSEIKKEEREFNSKKKNRAKARAYCRKRHPGKRGEKRGRPKQRSSEKYKPCVLSNGDTKVELLTRAGYIRPKSGDKWSRNRKKRAELLFDLKPKLKEAHSLVCRIRCIFKNRKLTKDQAGEKLRRWYKNVSDSKIKEIIPAKDCIKYKEEQVLNCFDSYSTNAAAESLNSKMKGFRAEFGGVSDLPFYMYRCSLIFG